MTMRRSDFINVLSLRNEAQQRVTNDIIRKLDSILKIQREIEQDFTLLGNLQEEFIQLFSDFARETVTNDGEDLATFVREALNEAEAILEKNE